MSHGSVRSLLLLLLERFGRFLNPPRTNNDTVTTKTGSRAARTHKLIDGRAWSDDPDMIEIHIRVPAWVVILLEQYGICCRQGHGNYQGVSSWFVDRAGEAIKECENRMKRKLAGDQIRYCPEYALWNIGGIYFISNCLTGSVVDLDLFNSPDSR
jgi:hypothetical protein